jgi:hypothetical protein
MRYIFSRFECVLTGWCAVWSKKQASSGKLDNRLTDCSGDVLELETIHEQNDAF